MANRLNGEASFCHGDDELTLRFDAAALIEVEDETGVGLLAIEAAMSRLRFVGTLLRVGLKRGCEHDVTLADAVDILATNPAAHGAVLRALDGAFPDASKDSSPGTAEDAPADPRKAARKSGAGKTS